MVMEALAASERLGIARYISEQPPYNLLDRRIENELIPLGQRYGLAILPWSPLAGGILAGRYSKGQPIAADSRAGRAGGTGIFAERVTAAGQDVVEKLAVHARGRGMAVSHMALLWCMDQAGVTSPIIGPRTLAHLDDQLPVLEMKLTDEDRAFCDGLVHPGNAVADFHNSNPWMKARIV